MSRNFLNISPCKGLVMKSAHITSVGQYSMDKFRFLTWSVRKKYLTFSALDLFPALLLPLFSNKIALLLSWNKIFLFKEYPCCSINQPVHNIIVAASSAPTSSASVLLLVFDVCFFDIAIIEPSPSVITAPVWLL